MSLALSTWHEIVPSRLLPLRQAKIYIPRELRCLYLSLSISLTLSPSLFSVPLCISLLPFPFFRTLCVRLFGISFIEEFVCLHSPSAALSHSTTVHLLVYLVCRIPLSPNPATLLSICLDTRGNYCRRRAVLHSLFVSFLRCQNFTRKKKEKKKKQRQKLPQFVACFLFSIFHFPLTLPRKFRLSPVERKKA